jgi:hypothetical protein
MTWVLIAIALMIISFAANAVMTENCQHDWEDKNDGTIRCTKCKKRTRNKGKRIQEAS